MSANDPWLKETGTGKFYVNWENERGEIVRRYHDELSGGQSNQFDYNREEYITPRIGSNARASDQAEYEEPSSRHLTSQQKRRESVSFGRSAEPTTKYQGRSEPQAIYSGSRSNYNRSDQTRDVEDRRKSERRDSSPLSETSQTSRRRHATSRYADPEEPDDLSLKTSKMTIDDVVGSPRYMVSASAPANSGGQWTHTTPARDTTRVSNFEKDISYGRSAIQESLGKGTLSDIQSEKVKGETVDSRDPKGHGDPLGNRRHISGTDGDYEQLDPTYEVRNHDWKKFFRRGRVFSTLWTDSYAGATNDSENNQFDSYVSVVKYGEKVHSKIRRFVVVRMRDRCCTCLPVTTYSGRGAKKRGIKLSEHGLIFSTDRPPAPIQGIDKEPLRVVLSKGAERVNNHSFINYGRPYTVETNVKVKDVGELDSASRKLLRAYYTQANELTDDEDDMPVASRNPQSRAADLAGVGAGVGHSGQPIYGPPGSMRGNFGGQQDRSSTYNSRGAQVWAPPHQYTQTQDMRSAASQFSQSGSQGPPIRYATAPTYNMGRTNISPNYAADGINYSQNQSIPNDSGMYQSKLDQYGQSSSRSAYNPVPPPASSTFYTGGNATVTSGPYARHESDKQHDDRHPDQIYDDRRPPLDSRNSRDSYNVTTMAPPYDDKRPPIDSRNSRDSYTSNPPISRSHMWNSQQNPLPPTNPPYHNTSYEEPYQVESNIELPTFEQAAQASRHRRESVSGRSGGKERDERHRKRK